MDIKILTYHINRGWVPYWRDLEEKEKVFLGYSNHDSKQVITDLWIKLETNNDFDTIKLNLIHDKIDILSEPRFYVSIYENTIPDDYAARGVAPAYNELDSFLLGNIWNGAEGENIIIKLSTPKEAGTYYINIHSNQAGLYAKKFNFSLGSTINAPEEPATFKISRDGGDYEQKSEEIYSIIWRLNGGTGVNLPTQGTMTEVNNILSSENLSNYISKEYYTIKKTQFSGPDSWGILRVEVEWELNTLNTQDYICINFFDIDGEQSQEINEKYYIPNTQIQLPANWKMGSNQEIYRIQYYKNNDETKYYSPHIKYSLSDFSLTNNQINLYCVPFESSIAPWPLFARDENGEWQTAYNIYIKEGENQWQ